MTARLLFGLINEGHSCRRAETSRRTGTRIIPNQWQDAASAPLSEPAAAAVSIQPARIGPAHHQLRRRQHVRQDPDDRPAHRRAEVDVLWVKGSGGDLGSMKLDGFATLYLDKLQRPESALSRPRARGRDGRPILPHCTFNLNPRATSIDTPLHCYMPHPHVDHMHADALIAIAAARERRAPHARDLRRRDRLDSLAAPGFDLGLQLEALVTAASAMNGLVLGSHGLFTWAATGKACYRNDAADHQAAPRTGSTRTAEPRAVRRRSVTPALPEPARETLLARARAALRGGLLSARAQGAALRRQPGVLEFVGSARARELAALGTSCPDHFLRTKVTPLFVPLRSGTSRRPSAAAKRPDAHRSNIATDYAAYYARCKRADCAGDARSESGACS